MAQLSSTDRAYLATLANSSGQAFTSHALAAGASESSVDAQHTKALAYLTNLQTNFATQLSVTEAAVIADAISHLTNHQAYLQSPTTHNRAGDR